MKRTVFLVSPQARQTAHRYVDEAPDDWVVTLAQKTRSSEQNARMWAMLTEVSRQVPWHGNTLTQDEWKDVFSAALKRQKVVPGIDGGFVVIGARTSQMTKAEMSELMELIAAFGAERGVEFTGDSA